MLLHKERQLLLLPEYLLPELLRLLCRGRPQLLILLLTFVQLFLCITYMYLVYTRLLLVRTIQSLLVS